MNEEQADGMGTERVEAFSDGVLAIIITIMVLELRAPHDPRPEALRELTAPTAMYGIVLFMAAIAFTILQRTIMANEGPESPVARATGSDFKGKASLALYMAAVTLAFVDRRIAGATYVVVALMWLIPDRRMERVAGAGRDGAS